MSEQEYVIVLIDNRNEFLLLSDQKEQQSKEKKECLLKVSSSSEPSEPSLYSSTPSSDVLASLKGKLSFDYVINYLMKHVDYYPYPQCTQTHLSQIDAFLIALKGNQNLSKVPNDYCCYSSTATAAIITTSRDNDDSDDKLTENTNNIEKAENKIYHGRQEVRWEFAGFIGVVWVPVTLTRELARRANEHSFYAAVEGYIQLVYVLPSHRKCGIATRLLQRMLTMQKAKIKCANDTKKQSYEEKEERYEYAMIVRWRLHTLHESENTISYLHNHKVTSTVNGNENDNKCNNSTELAKVNKALPLIKATLNLYRSLGFSIRRYCYNYYDSEADAVEMVRHVQGLYKSLRQ